MDVGNSLLALGVTVGNFANGRLATSGNVHGPRLHKGGVQGLGHLLGVLVVALGTGGDFRHLQPFQEGGLSRVGATHNQQIELGRGQVAVVDAVEEGKHFVTIDSTGFRLLCVAVVVLCAL